MDDEINSILKALFESRYLKRLQRSGTSLLLGPQIKENIVEHSFYTSLLGIVFSYFNPKLDLGKLLVMCIIHDLEEVRIGDLNQINRLYHKKDMELQAFIDMWAGSKLGEKLTAIHKQRHELLSLEAIASQDCDSLAELILEKEYFDLGDKEVKEWIEFTIQRLRTKEGKRLAKAILKARSSAWWEEIKNRIRKNNNIKSKDYKD